MVENNYGYIPTTIVKLNYTNDPSWSIINSSLPFTWSYTHLGVTSTYNWNVPSDAYYDTNNNCEAFMTGGSFGNTSDSIQLLYQNMPGDGSISGQITYQRGTTTNSLFGFMMRESTTNSARYVAVLRNGRTGTPVVKYRLSTGGATVTVTNSFALSSTNAWLQLTRSNLTNIVASVSTDGVTYSNIFTLPSITMAPNIIYGVCFSGGCTNAQVGSLGDPDSHTCKLQDFAKMANIVPIP